MKKKKKKSNRYQCENVQRAKFLKHLVVYIQEHSCCKWKKQTEKTENKMQNNNIKNEPKMDIFTEVVDEVYLFPYSFYLMLQLITRSYSSVPGPQQL